MNEKKNREHWGNNVPMKILIAIVVFVFVLTTGLVELDIRKKIYKPLSSKMVANGDSVAYGSLLEDTSNAFPSLVAKDLGVDDFTNYSIGGSTVAKFDNTAYDDIYLIYSDFVADEKSGDLDTSKKYLVKDNKNVGRPYSVYAYEENEWKSVGFTSAITGRTPLVERYHEMDEDADLVLISCGSNDFYYGVEMGTFLTEDGKLSTDETTFYGALNVLCEGLCNKYTGKRIVFLTLIKRCQYDVWNCTDPNSVNPKGYKMSDYCDAIKTVCSYYSIPVIDMYNICGLNPFLESHHALFADTTGKYVHPNERGHEIMADTVTAQLKSLYNGN